MPQNSIVYSQNNCQACTAVKSLLTSNGYTVEERLIDGKTWKKEDLFKDVPGARSVPQVIIDGIVVGGLTDVTKYIHVNK